MNTNHANVILPNPLVPTSSLPHATDISVLASPSLGIVFGAGKTSVLAVLRHLLRPPHQFHHLRLLDRPTSLALNVSTLHAATRSGTPFPQILTTQPTTPPPGIPFFDNKLPVALRPANRPHRRARDCQNNGRLHHYLAASGRSTPAFVIPTPGPRRHITYNTAGARCGSYVHDTFYGTTTTLVTGPGGNQISKVFHTRPNANFGAISEIFAASAPTKCSRYPSQPPLTNHLRSWPITPGRILSTSGQNAVLFRHHDCCPPTNFAPNMATPCFNVLQPLSSAMQWPEIPWKVAGVLG